MFNNKTRFSENSEYSDTENLHTLKHIYDEENDDQYNIPRYKRRKQRKSINPNINHNQDMLVTITSKLKEKFTRRKAKTYKLSREQK